VAIRPDTHAMRRRRPISGVRLLALIGFGVALILLAALVLARARQGGGKQASARPDLERVLDRLVTGTNRLAPGVAAYVSGPNGTWTGAAGLADVKTGRPMQPDTRVRLESVSKAWTAVVILSLVEQGRMGLDDRVDRWVPHLLPAEKRMITIRQLLNHTSGLLDTNDIGHNPTRYLRQIADPDLRATARAVARRLERDPAYQFPSTLWVKLAASLPLAYPPGRVFHYSNIGYKLAGMAAEQAGSADMRTLVRDRITRPLGLSRAAYDPHADITGAHAHGYRVADDGTLTDTTRVTVGLGAEGGIVSDAADEARFLTELMRGHLIDAAGLRAFKTPSQASGDYALGIGTSQSSCAGAAYGHNGGGDGFETNVLVSGDGSRVAVLLLNGRTADSAYGDNLAVWAVNQLYCAA
jgi:D-alanyl-D-alanine carboxypeptidase